jgi:hypothetical protein
LGIDDRGPHDDVGAESVALSGRRLIGRGFAEPCNGVSVA